MKKGIKPSVVLISFLLITFSFYMSVEAQETVTLESVEEIMECYEGGECIPVGQNEGTGVVSSKAALYSSAQPTMTLAKLNFSVKKGGQAVSGICVGVPVTLQTTQGQQTSTETYTFWSMPTDEFGKISVILSRSGVSNQCSNGITYTMTFATSGFSVATPLNDWPMGCCQITLKCGEKFCYSAPNIYGYAECLCGKIDSIFRCLGIGSAEWTSGAKCNYQTGLCENDTLIKLSRFDALAFHRAVRIVWETESEVNTAGFNIYRSDAPEGTYHKINDSLIFARGSAFEGASYEFLDMQVHNRKTYYYKLEEVETGGGTAFYGPVSATPKVLYRFRKQ